MKGGEGWRERHSHTKAKKTLFSLKPLPFFPSFSLSQLFSFRDSHTLSHHPLPMTYSTSFSTTRHVHIHNEHKLKSTQHSFHFIVFLSCSNSLLLHLFLNPSRIVLFILFHLCLINHTTLINHNLDRANHTMHLKST